MVKIKFFGQHSRNIDIKNRIALPSQYRNVLGNRFFILIGIDGHPEIRSEESINSFFESLDRQSVFDAKVRILRRTLFGSSQEIELDAQGRFIIPKLYMEKGAFQKEILFIGSGDYIELWDPKTYEKYEKQFDTDKIVAAAQSLADGEK